ncbi:MAG TPA: molybdenum cofactor biosynthesis protein MoaE [Anaerolineales bacterium]|nr:molybdenum cofactor biosynthesis protein MoaE [Anaerolineales bacterium]
MNNSARVLFFATFRNLTGVKETVLEYPPGTSVQELRKLLAARFPALAVPITSALVAVNQQYAFDKDVLPGQAEIAIFPPVSGGSIEPPTIVLVTEQAFDLNALLTQVTLPTTGAACFFTGMVRGITQRADPYQTFSLEYDAYVPMAEEKMRQIADEIRRRWPDVQAIAMIQRIGRLEPGTPTVVIACSSGHRDLGVFEAARYGIDRLKEIVPVWKKEIGPQGEAWVEGDYTPKPGE